MANGKKNDNTLFMLAKNNHCIKANIKGITVGLATLATTRVYLFLTVQVQDAFILFLLGNLRRWKQR